MKKLIYAVLAVLGSLVLTPKAFALVDVEGRYFFSSLDSTVKVSSGGTTGNDINFVNDLGIEEKKGFPEGRVTLELGKHRLRYAYMPLKWDGSSTLTDTFFFNGQPYTSGAVVESDLKLDYHRLGYEYDFINLMSNRLGVILEMKYFNGSARLNAPGIGLDESKSFSAPVPTIGIAAQAGLPFLFNVGAEVTGITVGSTAYLFDAEAGINFKPAPFVVIAAGYRYFKMHLQHADDKANFAVKGPFVMLRADF